MNRSRGLIGWLTALGLLAAAGVGGWFVGSDIVASQPSEDDLTTTTGIVAGRAQIEIDGAAYPNDSLILGASGLSPFGNAEGLQGRQVLAGRVITISDSFLMIETATGPAQIALTEETSFLLRLERVEPSAIGSGAAVTIVLDEDGETAIAAIALPAESRPTLNTPDPPARSGG